MYESPIEKIYSDIRTQIEQRDEELTLNAIRDVGINVDKSELIKALQYDRGQYVKGFNDALSAVRDGVYQLHRDGILLGLEYKMIDELLTKLERM